MAAFGVLVAKDGWAVSVRSQATIRDDAVEACLAPTKDEPDYIASFLHEDEADVEQ